jgi:hypothetical protein
VCTAGQQRVYGAARHEEVRIVCDVDANPPAGLFRWSFNNSAVQSLEVDSVTTEPGGGRSFASYKPLSERDYGTLLCWGRNELGSQVIPCVFHVVPAGNRPTHHQYDNHLCPKLVWFLVHVLPAGNKTKSNTQYYCLYSLFVIFPVDVILASNWLRCHPLEQGCPNIGTHAQNGTLPSLLSIFLI